MPYSQDELVSNIAFLCSQIFVTYSTGHYYNVFDFAILDESCYGFEIPIFKCLWPDTFIKLNSGFLSAHDGTNGVHSVILVLELDRLLSLWN